jgi:hypothetical protein
MWRKSRAISATEQWTLSEIKAAERMPLSNRKLQKKPELKQEDQRFL